MSEHIDENAEEKVRKKTLLVLGLTFVLPIVIILVLVTFMYLK